MDQAIASESERYASAIAALHGGSVDVVAAAAFAARRGRGHAAAFGMLRVLAGDAHAFHETQAYLADQMMRETFRRRLPPLPRSVVELVVGAALEHWAAHGIRVRPPAEPRFAKHLLWTINLLEKRVASAAADLRHYLGEARTGT